jgi:hypothetical protein
MQPGVIKLFKMLGISVTISEEPSSQGAGPMGETLFIHSCYTYGVTTCALT